MTISIHQPNFLPWVGFFSKLANSDVFVLFDDVQFPRGKSFGYRTKIKTHNGEQWLSVPVKGRSEMKPYKESPLNNEENWKPKLLKTVQFAYRSAPFFQACFNLLETAVNKDHAYIFDLNAELIAAIIRHLELETKLVCSSEICRGNESLQGEEKILFVLQQLKADKYISGEGEGSKRYLNEANFEEKNIELIWQAFMPFEYPQLHGEFIPNLSVFDLICNCGTEQAKTLLQKPVA